MTEGVSPLEVMLVNMRYFHEEAGKRLAETMGASTPEGVKVLDLVAGYRKAAQECARDAAPFCHPRLAAVEVAGPNGSDPFAALMALVDGATRGLPSGS